MFLTSEVAMRRINDRLAQQGCDPLPRTTFYRLRTIYPSVYPTSQKICGNRLLYDEGVLLFLYFCARAHAALGGPKITALYMQNLEQQIRARGQRFSEAFPSFSSIDSHFENAQTRAA